jgi:hypothetical protein
LATVVGLHQDGWHLVAIHIDLLLNHGYQGLAFLTHAYFFLIKRLPPRADIFSSNCNNRTPGLLAASLRTRGSFSIQVQIWQDAVERG